MGESKNKRLKREEERKWTCFISRNEENERNWTKFLRLNHLSLYRSLICSYITRGLGSRGDERRFGDFATRLKNCEICSFSFFSHLPSANHLIVSFIYLSTSQNIPKWLQSNSATALTLDLNLNLNLNHDR